MNQPNMKHTIKSLGLIVLLTLLLSFGKQVKISPQTFVNENSKSALQSNRSNSNLPPNPSMNCMLQEAISHNQAENPVSGVVYLLSDHSCTVDTVDFSPDGQTIISGGGCGHIIVHNVKDGLKVKEWDAFGWTTKKITFGLKGSLIAAGSGPGTLIKVFNGYTYSTRETLYEIRGDGGIEALTFSSDGQTLNCGDTYGVIFSWDTSDYSIINNWSFNSNELTSLAFNSQGTILASGNKYGQIKLWDVSEGSLIGNIGSLTNRISSLCFSPDSQVLASGSNEVKLWNITDGTLIDTLIGHSTDVYSLDFQAGGEFLASGSASGVIKIWNVNNGSLLATLNEHTEHVYGLNFHPDGLTLASASSDHSIKVWNVLSLISYDNASDIDFDGIPNDWEMDHGLNDSSYWDKFHDEDDDGLMNILEFQFGTNPLIDDSDNDQISDSYEYLNNLNGTLDDSQGDKDNDEMSNVYEYQHSLFADINDSHWDKDKDGLSNLYEYLNNLSPNNSDSDFDGMDDQWEIQNNLNPLVDDSNKDPDNDGCTNIQEYLNDTDPHIFNNCTTTTIVTTTPINISTSTTENFPFITAGLEILPLLLALLTIVAAIKKETKKR